MLRNLSRFATVMFSVAVMFCACNVLKQFSEDTTAKKLEKTENVKGYLFVHFRGERRNEYEQIFFSISRDGLKWNTVNQGKSVLQSELGERGVRDPFIIRNPVTDKIYIIATDLCIGLNGNWGRAQSSGSKAIIIWESDDMVNWSAPRRVEIASEDAGCTWAPEAFWDAEKEEFFVFWASMTTRNGQRKQRVFSSRTKDFVTFTPAKLYIEKSNHIIDSTIVKENGRYYRFSKDESVKAIIMETSDSLEGTWIAVSGFPHITGYEGPECFRLNDGTNRWCLLLDFYSRGQGYQPFFTDDLASGNFKAANGMLKFPYRFRHGSIIPLTETEYNSIIRKWGMSEDD